MSACSLVALVRFVVALILLGAGAWAISRWLPWKRVARFGSALSCGTALAFGVAFVRSIGDPLCAGICMLVDVGLMRWWDALYIFQCWC